TASVGGTIVADGGDSVSLGATGLYANRPTITYAPLTGNQYIRGLLTPLPPEIVFFIIESGYAADMILRVSVTSINGVANDATSGNTSQSFFRLATLFRSLQRTGAVTLMMRVLPTKERQPVLAFVTRNQAPQILPDQAELKKLLRVKEDANEFQLTFG